MALGRFPVVLFVSSFEICMCLALQNSVFCELCCSFVDFTDFVVVSNFVRFQYSWDLGDWGNCDMCVCVCVCGCVCVFHLSLSFRVWGSCCTQ